MWSDNKTTITFNEEFKQMIQSLKQLPEVQMLKDNPNLVELGKIQVQFVIISTTLFR